MKHSMAVTIVGGGEKRRNSAPAVQSQKASIERALGEGPYGRKDRVLCAGKGHRPIS
jgi:hypothetical protein